jgi:hypothetical protein
MRKGWALGAGTCFARLEGPVRLLETVDRRDVGMLQAGQGAGLALEAGLPFRIAGELGGQDLDRHIAARLRVPRAEHLARAMSPIGRIHRWDDYLSNADIQRAQAMQTTPVRTCTHCRSAREGGPMRPQSRPAACCLNPRNTLVSILLLLATCASAGAQTGPTLPGSTSAPAGHKWGVSFGGYAMSGRVTTALLPVGGDDYADMNPIERPFGISIAIDYRIAPNMRLFFDGNVSTYRKQVGVAGQYSSSFWVYEMTGYESHVIGPFTDDAFFYMDTTAMRLGIKYDLRTAGARPWMGVGYGIYSWKAEYATADRTGTWGSDDDLAYGATFLLGVDLPIGDTSLITVFGDFTSPVANEFIEDLFHDGWTWENSGGSHVMGPYRFGVSIGFLR